MFVEVKLKGTLILKELIRLIRHRKIKALFLAKTHNTFIQFFRYLFVGGLASVVDWAVLWLLYGQLNIPQYISVALAFLCGLLVNYILSVHFVFVGIAKDQNHSTKFSVYFTTGVIGLILTELFMMLFENFLNIHYMIAKIITTALVFGWNFGSKKIILYRKRDDE